MSDEQAPSPMDIVQPRAGCWILAVPVVMAVVLVGGYGAVIVSGARGRPATGEVASIEFTACPEAEPVLRARVSAMGLGDPAWETGPTGVTLTARMPDDPRTAAAIPLTLAQPGHLEVRDADGAVVVAGGVDTASVRLDWSAIPSTAVQLDDHATEALAAHMRADPAGTTTVWLDGEPLLTLRNDPPQTSGHLTLPAGTENRLDQLHITAERAVLLNSPPLPCPVMARP